MPAHAEDLRVATFAADFSREGPGLLLRDILSGDDPQVIAATAAITVIAPDIVVLTRFDWDYGGAALDALAESLADQGLIYGHRFTAQPNSGMATGLDLDGDGRLGRARDAMGYGRFAGEGGLAILSRWQIDVNAVRDLTPLLWRDLPGAVLPTTASAEPFPSAEVHAMLRLSSVAHWVVPVAAPGGTVNLMVWSATPPVFDGPEDMNGLRARDELRLWQVLMDGGLGAVPEGAFVIAGNSNLDPEDGDGDTAAMTAFLADRRWQDPRPASAGGALAADAGHMGDPALDTADWPDGAPGNLRVSYVLPSSDWTVTGAGVFWPAPDDPAAALLGEDGLAAGPHRLVWVDLQR